MFIVKDILPNKIQLVLFKEYQWYNQGRYLNEVYILFCVGLNIDMNVNSSKLENSGGSDSAGCGDLGGHNVDSGVGQGATWFHFVSISFYCYDKWSCLCIMCLHVLFYMPMTSYFLVTHTEYWNITRIIK